MISNSEATLNRKFILFMKQLNLYLNHFPKHEKHALCNLIRNTCYELYDLVTEGQKRYYKKTTLTNLDIVHEKLRMQLYLAYELGYFMFKNGCLTENVRVEEKRFLMINSMIDELGKMIGGWINKLKEDNRWN